MPAYFKESEPTGKEIWESMSQQEQVNLIGKVEEHFNDELFDGILDQVLWRGVKDEVLYDYLKDKVYLTIDFK
jgi:hypothetical protein